MGHHLKHPKAKELLKRVAKSFRAADTFILPDRHLIFVCGGPMDQSHMRTHFWEYAQTELSHLRFFLAEDAQKDYYSHVGPEVHNIAEFEDVMAEISTCVILFPESPGSFAELGYFSRHKELRRKLLIVNDATLQGQDSFIALGPVDLVNTHSDFKPAIHLEFNQESSFLAVKERLEKRITSKNKTRFRASKYTHLSIQKKFYVVFEIIRMFLALTYEEIEHAFFRIWHNKNRKELHSILSILIAAKYVLRCGEEKNYFCINRATMQPFLHFDNLDVQSVTLEIRDLYQKAFPEVAEVIRELG